MQSLPLASGLILVLFVLRDAFETMILPRRLKGRWRLTRAYYRLCWPIWAGLTRGLRGSLRESALSLFGPLSMLWLFALWALGLITGFGLILHGAAMALRSATPASGWARDFYVSGTTFVTLGLGDVVPVTNGGRLLVIAEAGMGFGFLAVIIGYMPVLYQGFSNREANISMLDARAGSPPSASELLLRHAGDHDELRRYLGEWERWAAELLESQISYPVLGFFRSQHVNQSWLAALTTLLDTCAVLVAGIPEEACSRQARLTFAMARHAVVDLAQTVTRRLPAQPDRLPPAVRNQLTARLRAAGYELHFDDRAHARLDELRAMYEPQVQGMGAVLRLEIPAWMGPATTLDNWQRSPWERGRPPAAGERHFT